MEFINCTPHTINVKNEDGSIQSFPSSGVNIRLTTEQKVVDKVNGFTFNKTEVTGVEGLPDPKPNTYLIVSAMVRNAFPNRKDLISPDTGKTAVRNEKGHIDYVLGFDTNL